MYAVVGDEWLSRGYDAPESVIAKEAADRLRNNSRGFYRSAPPEQLEEMLGEEAINAILQRRLAKAQAMRSKRQAPPRQATNGTHTTEEPLYVDEAEFRRRAGL